MFLVSVDSLSRGLSVRPDFLSNGWFRLLGWTSTVGCVIFAARCVRGVGWRWLRLDSRLRPLLHYVVVVACE